MFTSRSVLWAIISVLSIYIHMAYIYICSIPDIQHSSLINARNFAYHTQEATEKLTQPRKDSKQNIFLDRFREVCWAKNFSETLPTHTIYVYLISLNVIYNGNPYLSWHPIYFKKYIYFHLPVEYLRNLNEEKYTLYIWICVPL